MNTLDPFTAVCLLPGAAAAAADGDTQYARSAAAPTPFSVSMTAPELNTSMTSSTPSSSCSSSFYVYFSCSVS